MDLIGESTEIQCPSPCCDVCQEEIGQLVDRKIELSILIKAIDELGKMGEVKVTKWIRGGQTAWMKNIPRSKATTYGASPTGLSKEWWRRFIHHVLCCWVHIVTYKATDTYTIHPRIL